MSGDLVAFLAFLAARLDEAEATAWAVHDVTKCDALLYEEDMGAAAARDPDCDCGYPARVLREVAAKRAIITRCERVLAAFADPGSGPWADVTRRERSHALADLYDLAAVDSGHPGYQQEWKP